MLDSSNIIPPSDEISSLGICHLKRYWQKFQLIKEGKLSEKKYINEWETDVNMLAVLGLGIEQTLKQIYISNNTFEEFENWILTTTNNSLSQTKINEFNTFILNGKNNAAVDIIDNILTESDLKFWKENGYVIIKNAISRQDCDATIDAICEYLNINKTDASTWYNEHPAKQGIMVQLFQHATLQKNRESLRIRKAYEQIWQRSDIYVNIDKVGFNPPETAYWKFSASPLHWDVSLKTPIPFGTQGILYLCDTLPNQGAFTVVPGFHHKIEQWLNDLPKDINPRNEDLYKFNPIPIAANAGDFIIWHHALPHAASPNQSTLPRFVQYMNYAPLNADVNSEWI